MDGGDRVIQADRVYADVMRCDAEFPRDVIVALEMDVKERRKRRRGYYSFRLRLRLRLVGETRRCLF